MDTKDAVVYGGVSLLGLTLLGYAFYAQSQKNALIKEYTDEVLDLESYYKSRSATGEISEADLGGVEWREKALEVKEVELERKGQLESLLDALAALGIVYYGGRIAYSVVRYVITRWPPSPPSYPCPSCDAVYNSSEALDHHLSTQHGSVNPSPAAAMEAQTYFLQLPNWMQDYIAYMSGVPSALVVWWQDLEDWERYAILIATIAIIAALAWWSVVAGSVAASLRGIAMALAPVVA